MSRGVTSKQSYNFSNYSQDVTIPSLGYLKAAEVSRVGSSFSSVCQFCEGGMTLRSAVLSFSYLNANEHTAIPVKALQKQCEFLISYHTKR